MAESEKATGWLESNAAEKQLSDICGVWRDQMGSKYSLHLDDTGTTTIKTTRPSGKTMRTRGLIRIEWEDNYGRVVWGREGGQVLFHINKIDDTSLTWRSKRSKTFQWYRTGPATAKEDATTDAEEFWDESAAAWQWNEDWQKDWQKDWEEGGDWEDWEDREDREDRDKWHEPSEDVVKRRQQLRRELQEDRQRLRKQAAATKRRERRTAAKKQENGDANTSQKGKSSKKVNATHSKEGIDHRFRTTETFIDAKEKNDASKTMLKKNLQREEATDSAAEQEPRQDGSEHEDWTDGPTLVSSAMPAGMTPSSSGSMISRGYGDAAKHPSQQPKSAEDIGQPQAAQEAKQSYDVGDRLLSELCRGISAGSAGEIDPSQQAAQRSIEEQSAQGLLSQPWITPWIMSAGPSLNVPDVQAVTNTLEWHFSYANLSSDLYLRSLMMPGEGWVPLMNLLAFQRIAALGTDCGTLRQAAACSSTLELDSTGYYTRIRDHAWRFHWLPRPVMQ